MRASLLTRPGIAAVVFVLGWALQLLGHRLEGNRPALLGNIAQIFVAPLYLTAELGFSLGLRRGLHGEIARRLIWPQYCMSPHASREQHINRLSRLLVLLIGVTSLCAHPASGATEPDAAPPIVASFHAFWTAAHDKPFARQEALWDRYIEGPRATLYRSIVWEVRDNPQWQAKREQMLQARFAQYPQVASEIPAEAGDIETQLQAQSRKFRELFPDVAGVARAILVLAPNFDSKSGVLPDGTPVLALAVDTLALEKTDLRILLPHELFHLYDAEHAGLKNDGVMPGTTLTLPLFAEGLATYVSSVASPGHSDGQYLFQSDLGDLTRPRLRVAARDFLHVANTLTVDPKAHRISPRYSRWFEGGRTSLNPGYPNRAGYWLGLNLIRELRRSYSLRQLASWSPAEAERKARMALVAMAQ